jgi:hypothetical protein
LHATDEQHHDTTSQSISLRFVLLSELQIIHTTSHFSLRLMTVTYERTCWFKNQWETVDLRWEKKNFSNTVLDCYHNSVDVLNVIYKCVQWWCCLWSVAFRYQVGKIWVTFVMIENFRVVMKFLMKLLILFDFHFWGKKDQELFQSKLIYAWFH